MPDLDFTRRLFYRVFRERTDRGGIQMFRYLFVAAASFIVDFSVLFALTQFLHVHYLISAAISFCLGVVANYVLSISWVFNSRRLASKAFEFSVFVGIGVIGLLLTLGMMWVMTSLLGVYYVISKVIVTGVVFFWNFLARKQAVFNNKAI